MNNGRASSEHGLFPQPDVQRGQPLERLSTEKERCRPIFLTGSAAARKFLLAETNLRFRYFESDLRPGSGEAIRSVSHLVLAPQT